MSFLQVAAERPPLKPDVVFEVFGVPITNAILMGWLVIILFLIAGMVIKKKTNIRPSGFVNLFETLYEGLMGLMEQLTGNKKWAERLLPLMGTLFLYVGFSNLIGLIPPLTSFTYNNIAIFRTPSNDFNFTLSLALGMILLIQLIHIKYSGLFGYLGNYIQIKGIYEGFKKGIGEGFLSIINFAIGILDIISEIAKVISLSLRLFGNMFAGEMLAVIILGALAYGLPAIWLAMNLLVAVVQAMVFGSLTTAYFMMVIPEDKQTEI